jgi:hypothetical protein
MIARTLRFYLDATLVTDGLHAGARKPQVSIIFPVQ